MTIEPIATYLGLAQPQQQRKGSKDDGKGKAAVSQRDAKVLHLNQR